MHIVRRGLGAGVDDRVRVRMMCARIFVCVSVCLCVCVCAKDMCVLAGSPWARTSL